MTEETGTILDFHFNVDYQAKRIGWFDTGGPEKGKRYTLNELYCALQELFDDPDQMDCLVPMHARGLYEYQLTNGWTITPEAVAHLRLCQRPKWDWLLQENGIHIEGRSV